jgi:SecD/SecF fusion protein
MNKRPVILRVFIALVVIAIFAISIPPLAPLDFYQTFKSLVKNPADPVVEKVIEDAGKLQTEEKGLYPSLALLQAANEDGVELKSFLKDPREINDNRDVIGKIRKNAASSIRLGIDLNGGVEFIIKLIIDKDEEGNVRKDADNNVITYDSEVFQRWRDLTIESLRKRLETQNIFESEISPIGQNMVSLKAPIVSKDEKEQLRKIIQMSAKLRFRLVNKNNENLVAKYQSDPKNFTPPIGFELLDTVEIRTGKKPKTSFFFVERRPLMTGKNIVTAYPYRDQFGQLEISLAFNAAGAQRFGEITKEYVNRQLAIVLDGQLYCAPVIRQAIGDGKATISGNFSNEEAKNISDALTSGSLPVAIQIEAIFDTDPTLGKDNVTNGIYAGLIALALVMLFMMIYYLRAGIVAVVALAVNIVLVLGALAAFNATLTLPGIAGIILTIGMAVDANVLIFERIREELQKGKSLVNSIDIGYSKAFVTIIDANLTTFFTAIILYRFGSGAIKGFAVTLSIGILTSMFTALFLTRLIFDVMQRYLPAQKMHMLHFLDHPKADFLGKRKIAAVISIALILLSIGTAISRGPKNILGIDFTGGTLVVLDYAKRVSQAKVSKDLAEAGYNGRVTYKTSAMSAADTKKMEILIRDNKKFQGKSGKAIGKTFATLLNAKYPDAKFKLSMEMSLGGLIGWEFSKSAMIAMALALLGIVIYISFRFEFAYAIASITALVHDVIIATGILLLFDAEISLPVIAALLTIIGYSLNDTIVVFDRIRENLGLIKGKSYRQIINMSINQTLSRTILTSLTTLLVLTVLFFFGGIAVNDFVFVMLIGVIVGTYSSVFVASPIVAIWHKRIGREIKDEDEIIEAEIVAE